MIRTRSLLYLAVAAAALGALSRHWWRIEDLLGLESELAAALPDPVWWVGGAAVLAVLSLLPLGGERKPIEPAHDDRLFCPEELGTVAIRVSRLASVEDPDVPLLVDYTVYQALEAGASDIHFDPRREGLALRYRIEGAMTDVATLPRRLSAPIVNRLKVISNLVVYRGALPQDGRIREAADETRKAALQRSGLARADFRISFMPTLHGERIVIRILGRGDDQLDLVELGMTDSDRRTLERLLDEPQGMIVLTGPTGSGKTTTIYAALRQIQAAGSAGRSIATLEDPIEVDMEGVSQSQVDEERKYTFDRGLRAVLRQDPDVIMVGEIRDPETARIAIQAGMTGHLIITTVHANSTHTAFSRLLELGAAPYSLNAAVSAVISQRLVRKICPHCRRERGLTEHDYEDLGFVTPPAGFSVFRGAGCEACRGTGYLGRTAIYEILEVTERIRELVSSGASADAIRESAREGGTRTLHNAALEAVALGITTPEEVARVISRDDR
ncbi:MAG: GspE/PulE family protein [Polyangia bacterium]